MAEYIIDKIEYGGNVYKLQDSVSDFLTGAVTSLSTTEGQHSTITNQNGAVSIAIPTKTSHLLNDEGFITSFTDDQVKSTALNDTTTATTYYITGSTSSATITDGLSKHAAIKAYVTANSGTGGSARIDLGNTTATTSAGGKEGIIRLYGTSATYYVELKAGAPSANRTISFPNKGGTVALTDDIPTVSYPVTSVNNKTGAVSLSASDVGALPSTTAIPSKTSDLTNDSGFLTSYTETDPIFSASAAAGITSTDISNWNAKVSDDKTWNGVSWNISQQSNLADTYLPQLVATNSTEARIVAATVTPAQYKIAKYNTGGYLHSTTPSANDNSTKVATTAYVDAAIPTVPTNISSFTNDSGYITASDITGKADKTATVSTISWDSTDKKITKTINGTTSDVVSLIAGDNITLTPSASGLTITASGGQEAYVSKLESSYTTTASSTTTVPIGINNFGAYDMLFVDINGLDLIQGTDYTIDNQNIVLTTPITTVDTVVHFTVIRLVAMSSTDYSQLKGDKGDKGDPGSIASLSIGTVSTGAAGSSASASIDGTAANPILNFTIPQGVKGDKGDKGDDGTHTISYESTITSGQQAGVLTIDGVSTPIYANVVWG